MTNLVQLVSAVLLLALLAGCSATSTATKPGARPPFVTSIKVEKSDSLAAEALQLHFKKGATPQALALLEKAADKAPKRADILWLYFELCAQVLDCNTEILEARLLKLAPTNGALQLGALARALRAQDEAATIIVLESIARSDSFEIYWNSLISKLAHAVMLQESQRPQPLTRSLNEVSDWYSSLATATFGPILQACSANRTGLDRPATDRCMRIANLLFSSDTYIAESVGYSIAQRLLTGEQAQKLIERSSVSKYQRDMASEIINAQLDRERVSGQLLEVMSKVQREQDVFLAVVRWGGQSLTPLQ